MHTVTLPVRALGQPRGVLLRSHQKKENVYLSRAKPATHGFACRAVRSGPLSFSRSSGVRRCSRLRVQAQPARAASASEFAKLDRAVRDRTLDAVDSLGRTCTVGDLASRAGLKTTEAELALQALAADTGAAIQVSEEGQIAYVFPAGFRGALASKSLALRIAPAIDTAKRVGSYLVRVSFGTTLLISVAVVYSAIFLLLSSRSDSDNRRESGGGGFRMGFFYSPFDLFWYWDPYYYQRTRMRMEEDPYYEMNFLEAVFSFVFGDGDPNEKFEERRWKAVGDLIQRRGGVVTAEQLAPLLDPPKSVPRGALEASDESFVLPALTRFGGHPEITPEGQLVYVFPSLQVTAGTSGGRKKDVQVAPLQESRWGFSAASDGQKVLVGLFGAFNAVGVAVLARLVSDPAIIQKAGVGTVQAISGLLPGLGAYAALFFLIPALRWLGTQRRNAEIEERNGVRRQYARLLASPPADLKGKLLAAQSGARLENVRDRIVYSSDKSVAELEEAEFDRRLKGL